MPVKRYHDLPIPLTRSELSARGELDLIANRLPSSPQKRNLTGNDTFVRPVELKGKRLGSLARRLRSPLI